MQNFSDYLHLWMSLILQGKILSFTGYNFEIYRHLHTEYRLFIKTQNSDHTHITYISPSLQQDLWHLSLLKSIKKNRVKIK